MADIDKLDIEISANVKKAIDSIDKLIGKTGDLGRAFSSILNKSNFSDNMNKVSKSMDAVGVSISKIDSGKIQSLANGIRSLSKSITSLNNASLNVNASPAERSIQRLDNIISSESTKLMEQWGISGKKNAEIIQNALKSVVSSYKGISETTGNAIFGKDEFIQTVSSIKSMITAIDNAQSSYAGLLNYIEKTNSSGQKISLGIDKDSFANYESMRATLGKAFGNSVGNGMGDINTYVRELNSALGQTIPLGTTNEETFENLVNAIRNARTEIERNNQSYQNYITQNKILQQSINETIRTIANLNTQINAGYGIQNKNPKVDLDGIGAAGIAGIKDSLSSLNGISVNIGDTSKIAELASNLSKLGGVKVLNATSNLPQLATELKRLVVELNSIGSVSFDTTGLVNLANAISRLGGKNAQNAISNIPLLKDKISELISELSKMPSVSASTQRTLDSIAKIAQYTRGNLGSATNSVNRFSASSTSAFDSIKKAAAGVISAFGRIGIAAGKLTGIERLFTKIKRLTPASRETESGLKGLAQKIGMLYASSFLAIRGFNKLKDGIESAMDYVEAYDYFKNAFNAIGKNADLSQWKKLGYDSAEAYYNSFRDRAEKVSSELTGFSIGKYGELTESKMPSLGLNPTQVMQTQAMFGQMSNSMGIAADTATKLSEVYTKLGADMASAFNMPFKEVWGNLQSGMVGMSRAVDKYGINIRNANLQQELANLGIDASINKLSQQDKVLLRTIVILNSSSQAWGNLAQTIQSPQNQIRLLTMNFQTLGQMIGSFFLPIVSKVLPYINGMVIALKSLVSHIGSLLGIDLSEYMKSMSASSSEGFSDALDASDGLADNIDNVGKATDKATKKQKKFNKQLQAFDELNNLTTNENEKNPSGANSSSGSPGSVGADLNAALDDAMKKYLEAWDKAFGEMEDKANNIANNIKNAFVKAWETGSGKEIGQKIASFVNKGLTWVDKNQKKFNSGLKKIAGILGTGINGFVKDLGWEDLGGIIGTGIKGAIEAETKFFKTVDWTNLGAALAKTLNSAIKTGVLKSYFKNMASKLKAGIETAFGFVKKFNFKNLGTAVGNGIKSFFTDMSKKNRKTGLNGWQELGQTLSTGISGISTAITEALKTVSWQDIGQAIVDFIGAIDFSDMGWKLGKLASALGNAVYQLVSNKKMWSNLGQKIADGINGFFSGMSAVDSKTGLTGWQSLGKSISDTILGLGDAIITALDGIHWEDVGQAIADLIGSIDWSKIVWKLPKIAEALKKAIKDTIKGALKINDVQAEVAADIVIGGFVLKKLTKGKIASAILGKLGSKFSVVFDTVKFSVKTWVLKTLSKSKLIAKIKSGFSFLKNGLNIGKLAINIAKIGISLGNPDFAADELARNLDTWFTENVWKPACDLSPLLDKDSPLGVFQLIPPVFIALNFGKATVKFLGEVGDSIAEKFEAAWKETEGITSSIDIGNEFANGILKGIANALIFPAATLYEWLIKPFLDFLGIHSPSTKARDNIGEPMADGVIEGIKLFPSKLKKAVQGFWKDVKTWWKENVKLPKITIDIGGKMQGIKELAEKIRNNIGDKVITLKAKISSKASDIKEAWENFRMSISDKVLDFKAKIYSKAQDIKNAWDNFKEGLKDKVVNFPANLAAKAENVREAIGTITRELAGKVVSLPVNLSSKVSEIWNGFRNNASSLWDKIVTLKTSITGTRVSDLWNAFKVKASSLWDKVVTFGSGIKLPKVSDIKAAIKEKWEAVMKNKLFSIPVNFSFTVSAMKSMINTAISWINKYIIGSLNKISIKIPAIKVFGKQIFAGKTLGFNISDIATFEKGGFPKVGQVYLARERGSELVGQIGNRHAVANNDQITDAVSDAVFNALNPLMTRMANAIIELEQSIQSNSGTTLSVAGVSDGDIVRIVKNEDTNYRRRTGKSIFA